MSTTERQRTEAAAMRRWAHLEQVQRSRAAAIAAERDLSTAIRQARAGGCSTDEITAAVAMIDRSAGR